MAGGQSPTPPPPPPSFFLALPLLLGGGRAHGRFLAPDVIYIGFAEPCLQMQQIKS